MSYKISKIGNIYNHNNERIIIDESNSLYNDYINYLINNGIVENIDTHESEYADILLEKETEQYLKRSNDGNLAYAKISAESRLAKLGGFISDAEHNYIEETLIPVRNEVLAGQWKSGLQKLENIGSALIGINLYERLHSQITNYIENNY